jgi:fatty-acyl-CoA synthase
MTTHAPGASECAADWIAHHARHTPDAVACVDLDSGRRHSYRAFNERIDRLAAYLATTLELSRGARVLVLSRNDPDVFEIQFACQRAGAIFVPLNWRLAPPELLAIARDCAAEVLFHAAEFDTQATFLRSGLQMRACIPMDGGRPSGYEDAIAAARGVAIREAPCRPGLDDPWALIYTSGTTGNPKGACVSYRMAFSNAVGLGSAFRVTAASRNVVVLPTFHTGGLNVFANPVFFHGGQNIIVRDFDAQRLLDALARADVRATHMLAVPTMHAMLQDAPNFESLAAGSLVHLAVAGAPCPPRLVARYADIGLDLRQCWGMTEVGPLVLTAPPRMPAARWGSSGLPSMFVQTRVVDEACQPVDQGQVGELLVQGPSVTRGYWRRPDADAAAFTAQGWFRTGDAVRVDEQGFFYIVDRWKDMFISGGENVYPAEIEAVLGRHPAVGEAAVVGVADPVWGEVGRAFVVLRPGMALAAAELRAFCEDALARYKIPKEFLFVGELPHGPSGKVLKNRLREPAYCNRKGEQG